MTCDTVLAELEKIDDDTDSFGVDFVKINDKRLAKQYGIKNFPALTYFRSVDSFLFGAICYKLDKLQTFEKKSFMFETLQILEKLKLKFSRESFLIFFLHYRWKHCLEGFKI